MAQNAKEISDLGQDLYKRLATMGEHFAEVGDRLAGATDAYNKAVASLETRVLVRRGSSSDLGAGGADDQIAELSPAEKIPRLLQAPELIGGNRVDCSGWLVRSI